MKPLHSPFIYFFLVLFLLATSVEAQLTKMPLPKYEPNGMGYKTTRADDTIYVALPFYEDFATFQLGRPDVAKWEDGSGVFINNSLGIRLLSAGMATFDGQDETGTPYNLDGVNLIGVADRLVSNHFDFSASSGVSIADSLILSFYWQAKGLGELPNAEDFLELQFLDHNGSWVRVWSVTGGTATDFMYQEVRVNQLAFFHKDFQFRFINSGRLSGAYDVWNLDYIYFNFKDSFNTDIKQDMAIGDVPVSIFKTYTEIPVKHLSSFPDSLMKDTVELYINSIVNTVNGREGFQDVFLDGNLLQTDEINGNTPLFFGTEQRLVKAPVPKARLKQEVAALSAPDSVIWMHRFRLIKLEIDNSIAETEKNDTVDFRTTLHNYYAYDDGTAELGVGVNKRFAQIAYKFYNYSQEDTMLRYIDLHLTQLGGRALGSFRLKVWHSIDITGIEPDSVLFQSKSAIPITYPSQIDEFVRYDLGELVPIPQGEFYIGIEQITDQSLMIGFDKNTDSGNEIFFNLGSKWEPNTTEQGSLMLRPVFDATIITANPEEVAKLKQVIVFPNPTQGKIRWEGEVEELILLDMMGRTVAQNTVSRSASSEWNLPNLPEGLYILQMHNKGAKVSQKLYIRR